MAESLSIGAAVVGIIVPALHDTRRLLKDLQQLKDAPKTIQRLIEDVRSVDMDLKLLEGVDQKEWALLGAGVAEQSRRTIKTCGEACELFRADLKKWTRHSADGELLWQDRLNVGVMKKSQVKAMSEQLVNCKLAINSVVSVATLYNSVRHSHVTDEIREMISTRQSEVAAAIVTTDRQLVVLENRLEEIRLSEDEDDEEEPEDNQSDVLGQLEEQLKGMKASQALLQELLAKTQEDVVAKAAKEQAGKITVTFGTNNSGFQAGVFRGEGSTFTFGKV